VSEENVKIAVATFEAVNARDFAAVVDAYADHITLVVHHRDLGVEAVGKPAVVDWFSDWFSHFAHDYRFDVVEARGHEDRAFVVVTHYGRGRASGVPVTQQLAYVFTVDAGKISRMEVWPDREPALEAAGL
jgi:ketosteroid isomerase-like protein